MDSHAGLSTITAEYLLEMSPILMHIHHVLFVLPYSSPKVHIIEHAHFSTEFLSLKFYICQEKFKKIKIIEKN